MAKQKEAWDKLSMQEKALLIKLSVENGVSSLKLIRDTYNLYSNGGLEEILNKVNSSNANFARNAAHWHDGKNGDSKLHISPVTTGGAGYIPPRDITDLAKGLAYNIMTQSALQNRSFSDILSGFSGKDAGTYTGGYNPSNGWQDSKTRDLVKLYIYGNYPNSEIQELTGDNARGFSYTSYIDKMYPSLKNNIKLYKGIFPSIERSVSPEVFYLAKALANTRNQGATYTVPAAEFGNYDFDDIGNYRVHFNEHNNNPEIIQTDLWDFGKDYNNFWLDPSNLFETLQGKLATSIGTPFILKDITPLKLNTKAKPYFNEDPYNNFDSFVLRQAIKNNIMYSNSDGVLEPLITLDETVVTPQGAYTDESAKYINSSLDGGESIDKAKPFSVIFSTGGPLYPFSFEKNPFLKTPVVRYDEGGKTYTVKKGDTFSLIALNVGVSVEDLLKLNPTITNVNRIREGQTINIPVYMFSEIFNTPQSTGLINPKTIKASSTQPVSIKLEVVPIKLEVVAPTQKGLKTAGPLDLQELAVRLAYTESRLRPDIVNSKGAYGLFQIMQPALDDYNRINKTNYTLEDMKNADNNIKVRNWYMNYLSNLGFINKGDILSDSILMYKTLAAFNAGAGPVRDALTKAKADGKDIYDSWDWTSYLWDEPKEYADFILRGIETKGTNKQDSAYKIVSKSKSGTIKKIKDSIKL